LTKIHSALNMNKQYIRSSQNSYLVIVIDTTNLIPYQNLRSKQMQTRGVYFLESASRVPVTCNLNP